MPKNPAMPEAQKPRWLMVMVEEASSQKPPLSAARAASEIHTQYLMLDKDQQLAITELYSKGCFEDHKFRYSNEGDQLNASTVLGMNHLDFDALGSLGSWWSVKWSRGSSQNKSREV
jgi:hypothetical protein